ncbi:MAG: cell envelope integrity protein TolA [Smithella sp.]
MTFPTLSSGYDGKDPRFYKMIVLSLAAHLIVITIVLISIPSSKRHLTFGPVYSVSLVSSDVVLSKNQGSSSLVKEFETFGETASSMIYKKEISRQATTPVKKEDKSKFNVEKALNAIKQREAAHENPVNSGGRTTPSETSTGTAGAKSRESGGAQRNEYVSVVWAKIQRNWTLPPSLMPKGNIETIIAVRIARSGGLEYVNFEKRSGNHYFDDAALKAVKKSSPFPPFPRRFPDDSIEIGIRFHPSQFR